MTIRTNTPPGATFWRVPVSHFSPWDFNWPFMAPADAVDPNSGSAAQVLSLTDTTKACKIDTGSYVEERNRIFHDDIPIPGTDLTLHYSGDRVPGHSINIVVPASGDTVPASLKRITVELQIAGRTMQQVLDPLPNQIAEFLWDGTDLYGRTLSGRAIAHIKVGFEYDNMYFTAGNFARAFGQAGLNPTGIWARIPVVFWLQNDMPVTVHKGRGTIAEGWNLSNHHYMSPVAPTVLFKGDGTLNQNYGEIITTIAGNGAIGFNRPDGIPATEAALLAVAGLALDKNGNLLFSDGWYNAIRFIDKEGFLNTRFNNATSDFLTVDAEDNLYIVNSSYSTIQKIDSSGNITHFAGAWSNGYAGDGGPATNARFNGIGGIAFDTNGNTYISDKNNYRIRKVDTNGIVTTVAGTGDLGFSGDGGPALEARIYRPGSIAVDKAGVIYFVDLGYRRIRKIDTSGIITTVAGNGGLNYSGDGVPATQTGIGSPSSLTVDPAGNLYFILGGRNPRVVKMDTRGILTTVVGSGLPGYSGDGGPANLAQLNNPIYLALGPDGTIYIGDQNHSRIRKVAPLSITLEGMAPEDMLFVDDAGLGYLMSQSGHHQQTVDLDSRAILFEFTYDPDGRLEAITDRLNDTVVIERDGSGVPTGIVSPDGIRTTLTIDGNNHLTQISYPDGGHLEFEYTDDGLLTAKTEPEGNRFEHLFDSAGQLTDATDDAGGHWQFGNYLGPDGEIIAEITTGEGDVTTYVDTVDASGRFSSTIIGPDGSETLYTQSADEMNVTKSLPCGMHVDTRYAFDTEYAVKYPQRITETTSDLLTRVTQRVKTYQDTNGDNIPDRITETVTVNGNPTVLRTEALLFRKTLTSPEGRTVTTHYDPVTLQTLSVQTPGLFGTDYDYDDRGRVVSTTTGTRSASFTYNAQSFIESATDPENHTTTFAYDDVGRLTQVSRPDGGSVGFSYDLNGNMTMLTTPVTVDHAFSFNGVNLQNGYATPLSGRYSFVYDRDRRLQEIGFSSGRRLINEYEDGRLSQTQTPEGLIRFTYSCSDKVESIVKGPESIIYGYDSKLVTSESYGGTINQILSYDYNNDFDVVEMTYAGIPTAYAYDNDGLLITAGNFSIARDPANGLPETVSGGGFSLNRTFNGYAELEAETTAVDGVALVAYGVVRDDNGRIIRKTETVGGNTAVYVYEYDSMGRLLNVWKGNDLVEEYQYDVNGTRIYERNSLRGIAGRHLIYDDEDRILEAGGVSYQYDLDGFLTSKTDGTDEIIYQYSSRGELLRVQLPDGRVIQYPHDPLGRRIAKIVDGTVVEKYLWQGLTQLLAVFDGNDNLLMRFEYADSRMPVAMTMEAGTYYLGYDQVGSLKAISDSAGNVVKTIQYDSFGNIISETEYDTLGDVLLGSDLVYPVPFGFAGGLHDRDAGLVRFGYRDYDPDAGRWTSKDPIFFAGGDTDLYGYVLNDPISFFDPLGLYSFRQGLQHTAALAGISATISVFTPGGQLAFIVFAGVGVAAIGLEIALYPENIYTDTAKAVIKQILPIKKPFNMFTDQAIDSISDAIKKRNLNSKPQVDTKSNDPCEN